MPTGETHTMMLVKSFNIIMLLHRPECTPTKQYHDVRHNIIANSDVLHFITAINSRFCEHLGVWFGLELRLGTKIADILMC